MTEKAKNIVDLLESELEERKGKEDRRQYTMPWEPSLERRSGKDRRDNNKENNA